MKASDMIKKLSKLVDVYGDLDLVFAADQNATTFDVVEWDPMPGEKKDGTFQFYLEDGQKSNNGYDPCERKNVNSFCIN